MYPAPVHMPRLLLPLALLASCAAPAPASAPAPVPVPAPASVPSSASSAIPAASVEVKSAPEAPAPVDGEAPPALPPAEKAQMLAEALVRPGDLPLPRGGKLAGPCVRTHLHAAATLETSLEVAESLIQGVTTAPIDLDGDGAPDEVLFLGAAGMTTTYGLYVMRGGCGYPAGFVEIDGAPRATPRFAAGLRVLEATSGCPIHCCEEIRHVRIAFDGKAYGVAESSVEKRTCAHRRLPP